MNGFNRVFLLGYLGAEPERQTSRNGKSYVKLSVATHYNKRLDKGGQESSTVWHRVTVWGKTAENCQSYLHKGSPLAVEGYLSRYSYSREDGTNASTTSVVAREVHFIGGRRPEASPLDSESPMEAGPEEFLAN